MDYGLLGRTLKHSHSPRIHAYLGSVPYDLIETDEAGLDALLKKRDFKGLNVTMPYKKTVMPYCDVISERAGAMGSVNTLYMRGNTLHGDNTDGCGLMYMAQRAGIGFAGKKTLVLGSGGAGVCAAATARGAGAREVVTVSRSGADNYGNIARHRDADIIVNATPVGMYPENDGLPVDIALFDNLCGVLDMVYNPLRTNLVLSALDAGVPTSGGLPMLVAQAKASAQFFLDRAIDDAKVEEILSALTVGLSNLVLVGMPGSGKSAGGEMAAKALGFPFVDVDAVIVDDAGVDIPSIFAAEGEAGFRQRERAATANVAATGGRVIATGGGAVLSADNMRALRQNGVILHVERDIDALPTDGRPLSKNLADMYRVRLPYYKRYAYASIYNDGTIDELAQRLTEAFHEAADNKRP